MSRRGMARRAIESLGVLLLLMAATEREARAYTDPGTGALIWQVLAAGFVGFLFYFRKLVGWVRLKRGGRE